MGSQISTANAINSIVQQSDSSRASSRVVSAIHNAASKTGVDFSYLMKKASQESSFDPAAKATTSSATGLFQFTSQTWLHMIKEYGDQYGLGEYADKITKGADGRLSVADPADRAAILALRKDPQISAEMAGELDKENAAYLKSKVGGKIGSTELYLAHFLGANGAAKFIRELRSNPNATAAQLMPSAASANKSVFYTADGDARTVKQIYQKYAQKFDAAATTQLASATGTTSTETPKYSIEGAFGVESTRLSALSDALGFADMSKTADVTSSVHAKADSAEAKVASVTGSTLFNAMIIGQVQDAGLTSTSPVAMMSDDDEKKKNALSALSGIG